MLISGQKKKGTESTDNMRVKIIELIKEKEYGNAIQLGKKAFKIDSTLNDSLAMAKSLYLISRTYALSGDFGNSVEYGEKGASISMSLEDYSLEYKINNTLSWAYYMVGKDFSESLKHQERQIYLVNQLDDPEAKALVYNNYGYDTTVSGTLPLVESIEYMKFANDYYANQEGNDGRWYTLMNLTWQYRLSGDLEKSEYFGRLAVNQAEKDKDRHAIIEANTNLGETLIAQNKLKVAKRFYEDALKWSKEKKDRDKYVFDVYYGRYLWELGEKDKAIQMVEEAVEFLKTSEVFYEMLGRAYLAKFYFSNNDLESAMAEIEAIENPRSDYVSFETRFIAAITKYNILKRKNRSTQAENFLKPYLVMVNAIGAKQLDKLKDKNS
jgi:tetratricopeptide (TPR) repeat protein